MNSTKEVMQLSPGRVIDILVAEHIMGWQIERDETKLRKLQEYFVRDEERRWWRAPEGAGTAIHRAIRLNCPPLGR